MRPRAARVRPRPRAGGPRRARARGVTVVPFSNMLDSPYYGLLSTIARPAGSTTRRLPAISHSLALTGRRSGNIYMVLNLAGILLEL